MAAVGDLLCLTGLDGRRCVSHADLAAAQALDAVVVPIPANTHTSEQAAAVQAHAAAVQQQLSSDGQLSVCLDASRKLTAAAKFYAWERAGTPLRLEVGAAEAASGSVTITLNPGLAHRMTSSSGCAALLRQYGGADGLAAAAVSSSAGPAAAVAVPVFGAKPVKLRGVPAAEAAGVCRQLLAGCSSTSSSSRLLPHGCCHRLHLWPKAAPPSTGWAASCHSSSNTTRPCAQHLQYLLGLGRPCHCDAAPHVDLAALKAEVQRQVQLAGGRSQRLASALERSIQGSSSKPRAVSLFVSGLPLHWPVTLARPAIAAAVHAALDSTQNGTTFTVSVASGGGRSSSCCRGWAKVALPDLATATAVMEQLGGHLELTLAFDNDSHADTASDSTSASTSDAAGRCRTVMVAVTWCSGRADALFPSLPYCCRRALRLDAVAAFSTTDEATARSIAALLHDLALLCRSGRDCQLQQQQQQLSALDLTACAGGSTAALLECFGAVTAVELDPDRAEDLLHNVTVFLGVHQHTQQEQHGSRHAWRCCMQQQEQEALGQPCGLACDRQLVPHLAVLCRQSEPGVQQQGQQEGCRSVAVVCGDAVRLLPHIQQQDVIFIDPPWGGPHYMQGGQASGSGADNDDEAAPGPGLTGDGCCAAASMGLGDMPLLQLCCAAAARCRVLAVRLPSRCVDLRDLARGLLAALAQQQQGKEQVARCAAVVRYGRSSLLLLVTVQGGGCGPELAAAVKARLHGLPSWTSVQ